MEIPKVNYMIATYEAKTSNPSRIQNQKLLPDDTLHFHMLSLKELIKTLVLPLTQITIIKPKCTVEKYENYYRFDEWNEMFKNENVKIEILEFEYSNLFSYGQWIGCYEKYPNFDYYILMEDDYVFVKHDFVNILIDLFKQKIPNGCGYMSMWCPTDFYNYPKHAAISNGIIDNKAMSKFNLELFKKNTHDNSQVYFSVYLTNNGVTLCDFMEEYKALFWETFLRNFSNDNVTETLIVPIQYLSEKNDFLNQL